MLINRILALFAINCSLISAWDSGKNSVLDLIDEEDDVLVLTEDNFDQVIQEVDSILVKFLSPSCGHCKKAAPEYAKAATKLKERDPPLLLGKVDATVSRKLAERFNIQGFPTFKFFKKGLDKPLDYEGARSADAFHDYVVKYSSSLVKIISTTEELDEIKEKNDVVVFTVLSEEEGKDRKLFEEIAMKEEAAVFVATLNKEIYSECNSVNCVVLLKKFDEEIVHFKEKVTAEAVTKFVNKYKRPLIINFSQETAPKIFGGDINTHVLIFADSAKEYGSKLQEEIKVSAVKYRGELLHIIVPPSENRLLEFFGLKEDELPAIMLITTDKAIKKYRFDLNGKDFIDKVEKDFSKSLIKFITDYKAGLLKPILKSQAPVDDSDEAVKVIVGSQFEERVINSDKDVLMEFYAPWCGHCKALAPIYQQLAEEFSEVDSIMIAKMDSTENEIAYDGVDIQGYPTIIFFPAKTKKAVVYDGARDIDGMTKFLMENAGKFELDGETYGRDHDEL